MGADVTGGAGVLGRTVGSLWVWVRPVTGGFAGVVAGVVAVGVVAVVVVVSAGAVFTALVSFAFLCAACLASGVARTDERGSA